MLQQHSKKFFQFLLLAFIPLALMACAGNSTNESTGEYIDDTVITAKVKARLLDSSEVDSLDIQVETFKGTVQLSGFADSYTEKFKAGDLAENVTGVKSVENDIAVK